MARIAVAGFLHETNTFAPIKTTWEDFLRAEDFPGLTEGPAILDTFPSMNVGVGGFIGAAEALGHELLPIAWCAAVPAAHVSRDAFERMVEIVTTGLAALEDFDAVYLDLHGAMVTDHLEDGEGDFIARVREAIGPDCPLVVSLDLHSNTTEAMMAESDGLIAYRTYPHIDMADTGARAARYLDRLLEAGEARPAKARRAVPFLMPLTGQCTMMEPMQGVYGHLAELEADADIWGLSFTPGFPPADIHDCGPVVVAYGEDQETADGAADALFDYIMAREAEFAVPMLSPDQAVANAMASNAHKPFVLADIQDNCGTGGTSDTTGVLAALVRQNADAAVLGVLVDPQAAAAAHAAGEGAEIDIALGGKFFTDGDPPFEGRFRVARLGDGKFLCTGAFYRGIHANLGPTALLTIGGVSVIVSTNRMQAADKEMFRHVGCEPADQKILVLKSSVHFRADFTDVAEQILVVEAPGAFIDRPETLAYENLRPGIRLCPNGPTRGAD
jgi:microcystin degradation protein MlrC